MPGIPASREFGRFVARRREDLDLEQIELASGLGWSVATQGRIERGQRSLRHDGEVILLARALKVSEQELRDHQPPAEIAPAATLDQVLTELREIRELIERAQESETTAAPPSPLPSEDLADAAAEALQDVESPPRRGRGQGRGDRPA